MTCEAFESRILDYQDHQLSPADRTVVESHLAACAGCRAFARRLQQLDAGLTRAITAPGLSADFEERLRRRIQAGAEVFSESRRAERKRQLQAEFEAGLAQLARRTLSIGRCMNTLGYAVVAGLAGWLAWQFAVSAPGLFGGTASGGPGQSLLPPLLAGAVFLCIGLAAAFPRPFHRLGLAV